jgi:hypothetical protein
VAELPTGANTAGGVDAVSWYVRPGAGGQYGPADTETFRQWVREGRVTADSLIWRDGWPNWQSAHEVMEFKLATHVDSSPAQAGRIMLQCEAKAEHASPAERYLAQKSRNARRSVSTIVILGIVAFALLITLIYIIISQI